MLTTAAKLHVAIIFVSASTVASLGIYAYRHREIPGAIPFAGWMATLVVWSVAYGFGLLSPDPFWRLFWHRVSWTAISVNEIGLLLFVLTYTGHDRVLSRGRVVALCLVPAAVAIGAWTNPWHGLMWRELPVVVAENGLALVEPAYGPLFWIEVVFAYAVVGVGAALLVRLIWQSDYLYTDQSILLLVGIAAPVTMNIIDIFVALPEAGIDYTPHAFAVSGLAFGYALFRRQLFDLVPATRQLGRDAAITQLDAGVLIVDNAHRIIYCNDAAGSILGCSASDAVGREAQSFIDDERLNLEPTDGLVEIELDDAFYEVRTTPITDRRDCQIGHTVVMHDVTGRKQRERELETLNDLNALIRSVNQALVSATSRDEIERVVCERVVDGDLFRTACTGDLQTWTGDADRWVVAGDSTEMEPSPPAVNDAQLQTSNGDQETADETLPIVPRTERNGGTWIVVPVVHGRTVYGALGFYTGRDDVTEREQSVLGELGETVGHAINAVETRRLVSAEAVVELELESSDETDPLTTASHRTSSRLAVAGLVPGSDQGDIAYVRVKEGDTNRVNDALQDATAGDIRTIRSGESDGLLEWQLSGDSVLRSVKDHGANVKKACADGGLTRYELEIASEANVRTFVDHLERQFPETRVVAKRQRSRPVDRPDALPGKTLEGLTDRQHEAIEAAYRAGYFEWPRDSNAEEVAETLDITSATLHSHLRKAQNRVLQDIFDQQSEMNSSDL